MMSAHWLLWLGAGLIALFLLAQFVQNPGIWFWRVIKGGILGCLFVFAVNWVGSYLHIHIPFNPVTALAAGFLGIPGIVALVALKLLIFPA